MKLRTQTFLYAAAFASAAMLGGCNTDPSANGGTAAEPSPPNMADIKNDQEKPDTAAVQISGSKTSEHNDLYEFDYSYPAAVRQYPGLLSYLDNDRAESLASLKQKASDYRATAKKQGFPYHPYSIDTEWKTVTDLPGYLSLSMESYVFSGGAHGNTAFGSLVWDKKASEPIAPEKMFTGSDAIDSAMQQGFCERLDRERAKKRGGVVDRGDTTFSDCIAPSKQTIILGSSNGRRFDRIGILVGPYAAGPYAEGSYDVTLPVTEQIMTAVKPQYANLFSVRG